MKRIALGILLLTPFAATAASTSAAAEVAGEFRVWHRLTLTFDGPSTSEGATPNPFRDYRLDVTFSKNGRQIVVPGFYAADGNAAESSASSGSKWRVHFCPDEEGTWTWSASFRTGTDIAVSSSTTAGSATAFNGETGSVVIGATNKTGRDHRAQGRLRYVGRHQLQFAQTGKHFLKGGADSPENFLAFKDFDGTPTNKHAYDPHAGDWQSGDPSWKSGKGKNIIGALNYLAGKGMNSVYFLTMNVQGDGKDVWPWTSDTERHRFDCSKLDQWEIVFSHMDKLGLMLHVVTQETENDQLLDGGELGTQRKLYYRELVARFAHHLAVTWNIGEENTNTDAQRKAFAGHLHALDPYDGQVAVHTYPGQYDAVYGPLLGHAGYEGASLQMGNRNDTHAETLKWVTRSAQNGRKWAVCLDEIGPANEGVKPDADDPGHDSVRQQALWGNLMAGGAGAEWYFGYSFAHDDLDCEDWRSRAKMWDQTRWALDFFQQHLPFWQMTPSDSLTSAGWCLAKAGDTYSVYLPSGGTASLQLPAGTWSVQWYNPRAGGALQAGSVTSVVGGGSRSLGSAPADASKDWAVLVKLSSGGGTPPAAQSVSGFTLVNADSDQDLGPLTAGATINLAVLPTRNLNVRANTSPATVGSVRFDYDANAGYSTESAAPYALAGDSSGNYKAWTPTTGGHVLTATPYTLAAGGGTAGTALGVSFTVIDQANPGNQAPGVSAGPDLTVILPSSASLDGSASDDGLPNPPGVLSFSWSKVSGPGTVTFGSSATADTAVSFSAAGSYVLRLTASDGALSSTDDVQVAVNPAPGGSQSVSGFTLINADTDEPIFDPLGDGAVINLGTLPTRNLNIRANTSPATVGSVRFEYDGNANFRTESAAPYALAGDMNGDYNAWTPSLGSHALRAVPYTSSGGGGTAGVSKLVTFTVLNDAATPSARGLTTESGEEASGGGSGSSGGACGATGLEVLIGLGLATWIRSRRRPVHALKSTGRLLILAALLSLPLLGAARTPPVAAGVYQESGGIVVVEIESEPTAGGWTKESSLTGYTGSGYHTWRGGDLFNSPGQGILRYEFQIHTAGTYSFRIHNRHDAADSTLENDCFTRMDGGAWVKTFSSARGAWVWNTNHEFGPDQKPAASYQLAAGLHTLEFSGRSKNFSIDRFHLYLPSVTNPTDKTRPESSTTPGGGTSPPGGPSLSSLTLIDADTDQPAPGFSPLNDGAVLNLAALPTRNLNVRADPGPGAPGSVVFSLDGTPTTESSAPFSLAGDSAGDYAAWTPAVGTHVITATPYGGAGGTGAAGTPITITFTVVDAPGTPSSNPGVAVPEPDNGRDNENGDNPCSGRAVAGAGPGALLFAAGLAALALSGCRR